MMLTCQELTELVTDYVEGRQPLIERLRFELHLGMCRHCRAYLRQMKETIQTLGTLPQVEISPELCAQLLGRFREWKNQPRTPP